MSQVDASEVRLAPFGDVYVAPVGTAIPTNVTTPWATVAPAWKPVGYITEDGVGMTPNTDFGAVKMWQSTLKLKQPLTDVSFEITFSMGQVNETTTGLYFFNSTWVGGAVATLDLTSNPTDLEKALGIEWTDDEGDINRIVIYRGQVTNREAVTLKREEATVYGITYEALDNGGTFGKWLSSNIDLNPSS